MEIGGGEDGREVPSTKPEKKYWTQPTMSNCGTSMVTFFFIMSLRSAYTR